VNRVLPAHVLAPPIPEFKSKARRLTPITGKTFDLSQAVPSYPTFPAIRAALAESLGDDETGFYTDVPGLPALRQKIAATHRLLGPNGSDRVMVTAGANHAMYTALTLLVNPGEKVLLIEPYYFNYDMALTMLGIRPAYFALSAESGMQLEASRLIEHLQKNEDIRAVILITPNNPTGAQYRCDSLAELLAWTRPRGVEVILDETYRDFDPNHCNDRRLADHVGQGLTIVGSFSKSYSLTGYRVGYLILGEAEFREALKIGDTMVICASHIGQLAALSGLERCSAEVAAQSTRLAGIHRDLRARSESLKHFSLVSSGAFFAYVKHPFGKMTSEQAGLELFRETGILGLPGTVFGKSQEDFIRLSVSNLSESGLAEAWGELLEFDARAEKHTGFGKRSS